MKSLKTRGGASPTGALVLVVLFALAWSVACTRSASAQTLTALANFNGSNGRDPHGSLISDAAGDLFGTTYAGGANDRGSVFEIPYDAGTRSYGALKTLASFDYNTSGAFPSGGLIADAKGNLLGTTYAGGPFSMGTVFEIAYDASTNTYASTPTVLVSFDFTDGANAVGGLVADASGNLFGTTSSGGSNYAGTVFEIPYDASTNTYASTPTVLVSFDVSGGEDPQTGLILDTNGNLFGTTEFGPDNYGTVFEVRYDANTKTYASTPALLATFNGSNGSYPMAGLTLDGHGNLFGTTTDLGRSTAEETVFEVPYDASTSSYDLPFKTLATFNGADGSQPMGTLIVDATGTLFGTTYAGGSFSLGTVFEVPYDASTNTYASTPTVLVNFSGDNGESPFAGLIADATGNLFGSTALGGTNNDGTVFELAGSGFVPPLQFAGTPGKPNCVGMSISTLAHTYGGIAHAAISSGFANVASLQYAVNSYCGQ